MSGGGQAHQDEREDQHLLAAEPVAEVAGDDRAERRNRNEMPIVANASTWASAGLASATGARKSGASTRPAAWRR